MNVLCFFFSAVLTQACRLVEFYNGFITWINQLYLKVFGSLFISHITSHYLKHQAQFRVGTGHQAIPWCTVCWKVAMFWICFFHPSPSHPVHRDITASLLPAQPCSFRALTHKHWESWGVTECLGPIQSFFFFILLFLPFFLCVWGVVGLGCATSVHQSSFTWPLAVELSHSSLFLFSPFASKWCYVASLFPHHFCFHAFEWWACGKALEGERYSN